MINQAFCWLVTPSGITVYDVLEYLASGMSQDEILEDFPYLTKTDILACLWFAAQRERLTVTVQP